MNNELYLFHDDPQNSGITPNTGNIRVSEFENNRMKTVEKLVIPPTVS
jgi:hypothetical protein